MTTSNQKTAREGAVTEGDIWFPERLEAKAAKLDLDMLQRKTEAKAAENQKLKGASNATTTRK